MKLFSPGDGEGFVAAFVNNLVQLLILAPLCMGVLGFSPALVYGRILPGVAVSFLVGNLFYAWQALALARRENRDDVCALPYGISTPGLFAHVFLVMLPARQLALARGFSDPERFAWHAGLVACFLGGVLEFGCAFFAASIRRHTPQAAMLATLAGVGLGFLGLAFLFQIFAAPVVGLVTLTLVFIVFFGRVRFRGGLPATLVVLAVGTALAWLTGIGPRGRTRRASPGAPATLFPLAAAGRTAGRAGRRAHCRLSLGGHSHRAPRGARLAAKHRVGVGGGRRISGAAQPHCQRPGDARRGAVRLAVPDFHLHRPSGLEKTRRARGLFGSQRDGHHADLPHGDHGGADVAHPRRGRRRHHPVDRGHHHRAGVRGHAPAASRRGRRRPLPGLGGVDDADRQDQSRRRRRGQPRRLGAGHAAGPGGPRGGRVHRRRVCAGTGVSFTRR